MSNSAAVHVVSRSGGGLESAHRALYQEAQRQSRRRFRRPQAIDGTLAFANTFVWVCAAVQLAHGF